MPAVVLVLGVTAAALIWLGRLYLGQQRLVFRPPVPLRRTPVTHVRSYQERWLAVPGGATVRCWWVPGPRSDVAVLYLHGSEGHLSRELPTIRFLSGLGVNTLLVEYPGYDPGPQRPTEAGCYAAADAGFLCLTGTYGFSPQQVIVFGFSLGAAVATYLASRHRCRGLVVHSGFTSVPDMAARTYPYLPARRFCRTKMNSLDRIAGCTPPVVIIHSPDDDHIPIEDARALYRRARAPKKFVEVTGSHFANTWQRDPAVRNAWTELLEADTATWDNGEEG